MAELPVNGKQLAKQYQPSRLRNQIHSESTDDKEALEVIPIQAPDSQIVIPETQHEQIQDFNHAFNKEIEGSYTLSPTSVLTLNCNTVNKSTETTVNSPFTAKFFTKECFLSESTSTLVSSNGFSFSQPKKLAVKPSSTHGITTSQSKIETGLVGNDTRGAVHQAADSEHHLPCAGLY
jgi:hypothetical protein